MRAMAVLGVACLLWVACQPTAENEQFKTRTAADTGIDFANTLTFNPAVNILEYLYYYNGGGVGVGDFNGDGLEDLYFSGNQVADQLYYNKGQMQFENASLQAGISQEPHWSTGVSVDDINGDGHLDIYVSKVSLFNGKGAANELYINKGDGTFDEKAAAYGLDFSGFSTQAAFLDYDLDGDLDLYLLNHAIHSVRSYGTTKKREEKDSLSGDRFYENKLNETEGRFVDVTDRSGIYNSPIGYGLAIRVADFNEDGWPDLYVGNDFHENDLIYLNNQDGTFTEAVDQMLNHATRFTMGVDVGDLNNDGHPDIFSTDMMPYEATVFLKSGGEDTDKVDRIKKDFGFEPQLAHNHMQINQGDLTFSDISLTTETYATDWSWSVLLADFDNDWDQDIFISNGIVKRPNDLDYINYLSNNSFKNLNQSTNEATQQEVIDQMPSLKIANFLFTNEGDLQFSPLQKSQVGYPGYSTGVAFADLDADGDLDLVLNNINEGATILDNQSLRKGLSIRLQSAAGQTAKGAKIVAYKGAVKAIRSLETVRGFQSSSSHKIHLGAPASEIDSMFVVWPGGKQEQVLWDTDAQELVVSQTQRATTLASTPIQSITSGVPFPFQHIEDIYLDYEREQLIPEQLSHEGPAVVVADFNQDGIEDVFLGGARYQTSQLYLGQTDGSYQVKDNESFSKDSSFEDVDAAVLDLDADGDLDLYVVSGGNDLEQNNRLLTDRLYLNQGDGNMVRVPVNLPNTNGGTVSVGDFNKDGFEDIFVGSRSIPGAYGLSPDSFIIQNDAGKGLKIFASMPLGMVTSSAWKDLNNDGFLDLIIAGDWMPITVFMNKSGSQLVDVTEEWGLSNSQGMWNTLEFADVDKDGNIDILAGNVGENFKWKASVDQPVTLYLDDFDQNEQLDPIIYYPFFSKPVPFASKDKLAQQLPYLKKRFPDYQSFSRIKNIKDLTGKAINKILAKKEIKELRSMLFLNKGSRFEGIPLMVEAQQSVMQDLHYDSQHDALYFVGNYLNFVVELGANTANAGGVLSKFNTETKQFETYHSLHLPKGSNTRSIKPLGETALLVTVNDAKPLVLNK